MWHYEGSAPAEDPFVCFGAKANKAFGLDILDVTGSWQGKTSRRVGQRNQMRSWRWAWQKGSWQSTPDREETSRHEIGSCSSEGRPVKMNQHSLWLVGILQKLHVSDSLHMHKEYRVSQLNLLELELTQAYCSFVLCSFSPSPLIVFLVR